MAGSDTLVIDKMAQLWSQVKRLEARSNVPPGLA
jgi:hypothetical protein